MWQNNQNNTQDGESVDDACRSIFIDEAPHNSPDILAVFDLACDAQTTLAARHASNAEPVDNVEILSVRNATINTLSVDEIELTWATLWIHYLMSHNTTAYTSHH